MRRQSQSLSLQSKKEAFGTQQNNIMKKVLFIASLSNGETVTEEKGNFTTVEGELSPWQKLLSYCGENNLTITSLSLCTRDGMRWNIPSAGKSPKFRQFTLAQKPTAFRLFRVKARESGNVSSMDEAIEKLREAEEVDIHTVIEAKYDSSDVLQVWVSEESLTSWSVIQ